MAPTSKRNNSKKTNSKKAVSVSRKAKPSRSSKVTTVTNPYAFLDKKISDICILAERRDNAAKLSKEDHNFDLGKHIAELRRMHPSYSICVHGWSPQLSNDASSSIPTLCIIAVPEKKLPPNFVGYRNKHESDFVIVKDMKEYGLEWKPVADSVYFLTSKRRMTQTAINSMGADSLAMEEHVNLWTRVPSRDWKVNKHGKLDVRFVNFVVPDSSGELIYDAFDKDLGDTLQSKVNDLVEEYELDKATTDKIMEILNRGDTVEAKAERIMTTYELDKGRTEEMNGVILDAGLSVEKKAESIIEMFELGRKNEIKGIIREAFEDARLRIEDEMGQLSSAGYNEEILNNIKTFKLYPAGTADDATFAKVAEMGPYYGKAQTIL